MSFPATEPAASSALDTSGLPDNAEWAPGLNPDDLRELQEAESNPFKIVSKLPRESARLGYFSSICLIFNRMIGTGIFNSASVVFTNTQTIGGSLLLWVYGAVFALCGVIVYIDLGLSIPRWPFGPNGEKIATPRSGDAMNYLNYFLKRPMFLATCLFGITFIVLENTAPNSIAFAQNILDAAQTPATPGKIIAIAITANTVCCLLHSLSRKWGILLNNFLGVVKFSILVFVIIIGLVWIKRDDVASPNYSTSTSFQPPSNTSKLPYRYAEAIIYVMYPYGGFHQLNYVISEIKQPRRVFPRSSWWGVLTVATLYTAVNMTYAAIIPKEELFKPGGIDVGMRFFELTIGRVLGGYKTFFSILKAISAFGNLVVVTFTAARVKQEVAKEGILPFSLWFASSYDFSLRNLVLRRQTPPSQKVKPSPFSSEKTPAATLLLHWAITNLMVVVPVLALQPIPYSSTPAFTFLSGAYAYLINIVTFPCVSFGLLVFKFTRHQKWNSQKSQFAYPLVSTAAAIVVLITCLFPLVAIWVPDPDLPTLARTAGLVPWWGATVMGTSLLGLAAVYWGLFRVYILLRSARRGETLRVLREPRFKVDESDSAGGGGLTQTLEIVTLQWVRDVGPITLEELRSASRLDGLPAGGTSVVGGQHMQQQVMVPEGFEVYAQAVPFDAKSNLSVMEMAVPGMTPVGSPGVGITATVPVYVRTQTPTRTVGDGGSSLRNRQQGLRPQELE